MWPEPVTAACTSAEPGEKAVAERNPRVSVIIPHFNDLDGLDLCLSKLAQQSYPRELVEIIVADNNSSCGLEAVTARVKRRAQVVLAPEQGAGPARNVAVAAASGEILAFTDSDCTPAPSWIEKGVRSLDRGDIMGGRVDLFSREAGALTPVEAFEAVFAFNMERYIKDKGFSATCNLFVRRAVFLEIGPFRNQVSEDMEWSHRAVRLGFRLGYADEVVVGHPARRNWTELVRKWRRLTHESFAYHRLQGRSLASWAAMSLLVMASPAAHAVSVGRSRRISGLSNKLKAIMVLAAIRPYRACLMWRELLREASGRRARV